MGTQDGRLPTIQPIIKFPFEKLERRRLRMQASLDMSKSLEDRRLLGQFATPTSLAREIVTFGLSLLPEDEKIVFLDPALGTGSFYSALLREAHDRIEKADGYEVDPHYGSPASNLWSGTSLHVHLADFLETVPTDGEVNLLICNPPYVRHHLLNSDYKFQIQKDLEERTGVHMSGLSGLYCYFLLASIQWMRDGGVGGWLIPSEFMDVNYGKELKRFLLQDVTLLRIHRFEPNDVQFDDALVSSVVLWLKKEKPPENHTVEFCYGGSLSNPQICSFLPADVLAGEDKWTRFPTKGERRESDGGTILSDYFKIKRGIATGSNGFFILSKEQIDEYGLPMECFRPVLPSSRFVSQNEILADRWGNPLLTPQLFLLDCRLPEEEIVRKHPRLWEYLESGREKVSSGYLCRSRKKWYYQEIRESSPFLCTYMGRSKTRRPIRFLFNHSKAVPTNSYMILYPHAELVDQMLAHPELIRKTWQVLCNIDIESILGEGRVYGGGLHKIEPRELEKVPVDSLKNLFIG